MASDFDDADRSAAGHTAWKYGLQAYVGPDGPIISDGRSEQRWPLTDAAKAIARMLHEPLPKHGGTTFAVTLDDLEQLVLRSIGFERDCVFRSPTLLVWLTHDIDQLRMSYQLVTHLAKSLRRGDLRQAVSETAAWIRKRLAGTDPYFNLDEVLALEREYRVPSTFFFLQQTPIGSPWSLAAFPNRHGLYDILAPKIAAVIRRMAGEGVEIGVHGSFDSWRQDGLLEQEIETLEALTRSKVVLSRQHYLNYAPWATAELHHRARLLLDSSVGFTRSVGHRTRSVYPMLPPRAGRLVPVLQVPPVVMDVCLPENHSDETVDRVVDSVASRGGVLTAIWHNTSLSAGAPPARARAYRRLIERCHKRGAEFVTGTKILGLAPTAVPFQ